jgi:hypothetical protein
MADTWFTKRDQVVFRRPSDWRHNPQQRLARDQIVGEIEHINYDIKDAKVAFPSGLEGVPLLLWLPLSALTLANAPPA